MDPQGTRLDEPGDTGTTSAADTSPGPVPDRAALGRRLTALRERAGLGVREVAKAAGLPLSTVGGYLSGKHLPQPATRDQFERLLAALGVPADGLPAWAEAVSRLRRAPGPRPASAAAPYRGLAAYDVDDAPLFVGREAAVDALLARVDGSGTPVVVLAASGAGKSSLLRAGLVARLRAAGRAAVVTTPGADPLPAVAAAVQQLGDGGVLVLDQLEEALLADDDARPAVAALLERVAALHAAGTTVVLGLRADVFERALEHPGLAAWLAHPVLVGPLSAADLRRVVLEPAHRVGLEVDEALVDLVVAEATSGSPAAVDPGVLPLVSHALYATWSASARRRLTSAEYRAVGGLGGAIAQTAETVVAELPAERLVVVRRVLLTLVHLHDQHVTGRGVGLADLAGPEEADVVAALVDARLLTADDGEVRLAHEALLTAWPRLAGWIEEDREALRVHGRLAAAARHWQESGADDDLLYRGAQLETTLAWQAGGRSTTAAEHAFLDASRAAQERLARARRRSARRLRGLAAVLTVLALSTGSLAVAAVAQSRSAAHERDLAVSRQLAVTAQTLTGTDPGLSAQVAAAALATADTVEARSALLSGTGIAVPVRLGGIGSLVNGLAVSPDGTLVAAVTEDSVVALWSVGDDPHEVGRVVVDDTALFAVTFSPDGGTLLAGGDTGVLHAWSVADPASPAPLPVAGAPAGGTLYDVAASADGALLATAVSDGTVRLWSRDGTRLVPRGTLRADAAGGTVQGVALDPGGTVLAAAGSAGALTLWDVADPDAPAALGSPVDVGGTQIGAVAWSPDGGTVAVGGTSGVVRLVDVADPARPVPGLELTGPTSWVNDLRFSPDGTRLAAASSDRRLWVWDPATGAAAGDAATPTTLHTAVWSPDGTRLYASGADGVLREWDYPGPVLAGFASIPGQGAFGADGSLVVTSTTDGLHVWDTADPGRAREVGSAPAPEGARLDGAVDVSDALHLAVAGDTSGAFHAWDISDPAAPRLVGSVRAHTDWVDTVAFDATGTRMAVSSDDGSLTLWDLSGDLADGLPAEPAGRLADLGGQVYVVAFSPDATTLVASVLTGSVVLVDVRDLAAPARIGDPLTGPEGYVYSAAFGPDGRTIAATGNDGTLWLWDVADPESPAPLGDPLRWGEGYGTNTAFSPDGTRVAVGMTDGTVRVWDVTDPAAPVRFAALSGAGGTVYGVEFSPDGTHLTAAAADRAVRIWDVTLDGALDRACAVAGRGTAMTDGEWARVAGTVERPATCG